MSKDKRKIPAVDPNLRATDLDRITGQNRVVLDVLLSGKRITPHKAQELGITRLAARIHDLKRHGVQVKRKYDTSRKCAVYWMEWLG